MDSPDRASVSTHDLEALTLAVEWTNFLDARTSRPDLLDPCCLLDALSDVYQAALRLVRENTQDTGNLSSGSMP